MAAPLPGLLRFLAPAWVNHDGKLILLARGVRSLAQGALAVLLAIYLGKLGFSLGQIGAVLSAGVAGTAFFAFVISFISEKAGHRRLLIFFSLAAAVGGLAFAFSRDIWLLAAFSFLAGFAGNTRSSPAQGVEQACMADTAPPHRRTDVFALYGIAATAGSALGALAAGLPELLQKAWGLPETEAYRAIFIGYAGCFAGAGAIYALLSPAVETAGAARKWVNPLSLPSRRAIFTLTGLFSLDHFAGSLVIQSLVAYWFSAKFGIEPGALALVFFLSFILESVSLWLAAKIANRIGLINTMVFTHIPSSLFLIGAVFAPTAWLAVLCWQLRSFLGEMDVPTRESYTMAVVAPGERVAMASLHQLSRGISSAPGPAIATALWQALAASVPLAGAGVLKIAYDLALYFTFRNVEAPEERQRRAARAGKAR